MAELSRIDGGKELASVLRKLPDALAKNALDSTARAGANELKRVAYAYLSLSMNRSAREDDVIAVKRRAPKGEVQSVYEVGPPRRKPWLRWLHDGTKPHEIAARALYSTRLDRFFGRTISHPGQPPRPWLRSAQFASVDSVLKAMAEKIRTALPKQAEKLVSSEYRSAQLRKFLR